MRHLHAMSLMRALSQASGRAPGEGLTEAVQRPEFAMREGGKQLITHRSMDQDTWKAICGDC
jgi:hypothetical protein